ncbi:MAG: ABC transporter substrate-binding protein [Deltaproteobacteria bacterium]|nr:ABC transporter substrate-binding protein [Deltaproteobacteria bacterium]
MRVISMVPAWTETLLDAGVDVVGRTKFCVHPETRVESIPKVGGTKQIDWSRVKALDADLLVLDQQENPRSMADRSPIPTFATNVCSVATMPHELGKLAERLGSPPALLAIVERWLQVAKQPVRERRPLEQLPGVIKWLRPPTTETRQLVYVIWRDPWMAVSPTTFIGSMLAQLGFGWARFQLDTPYPVIDLEQLDRRRTLLLFSSEPFPFERYADQLTELGFSAALVDGAAYSWFGSRALRFLEENR